MKIKCKFKIINDLPHILESQRWGIEREFDIILDKTYLVYAVLIKKPYPTYCICDERYYSHPYWYPAPLFEIEDGSLSKYWKYSTFYNEEFNEVNPHFPNKLYLGTSQSIE